MCIIFMMTAMRRCVGLIVLLSLVWGTWGSAQAQSSDSEYFPQFGHNVKGEFLDYYYGVPDPTLVFGYPITERIQSVDGLEVQYFQRARFEYHPELPPGQQVQLTPLGRLTYTPAGQLNVFNPMACQYFAETGFAVCFAFLEFFIANGGVAQFGYPISPFEFHDNLIVQYFEKARFEWHPWRAEGERVNLADLGRIYFDMRGEDPGHLPPVDPEAGPLTIAPLTLQVRAFVWKAVTLSSDHQVIFVIVQDQNLKPVTDARGEARVHWPGGEETVLQFSTNSNGVAILPLSFTNQPYGSLVYMDISASWDGLAGATSISFRIWY